MTDTFAYDRKFLFEHVQNFNYKRLTGDDILPVESNLHPSNSNAGDNLSQPSNDAPDKFSMVDLFGYSNQ